MVSMYVSAVRSIVVSVAFTSVVASSAWASMPQQPTSATPTRWSGGSRVLSNGELPEVEIPAELMDVDGVAETMPSVIDMPLAKGVLVR